MVDEISIKEVGKYGNFRYNTHYFVNTLVNRKTLKGGDFMSLSEILIKLGGLVLALVGFALILSAVGINVMGVSLPNIFASIVVGVLFLGAGIYIVRGGNITL